MAVGQEPCGLILTPVIKEGSEPRFTANSEFADMLPKMGSDPSFTWALPLMSAP